MNRPVVILSDVIGAEGRPLREDELDTLRQVDLVEGALSRLGYQPRRVLFNNDFACLRKQLQALKPDFVFNLVEDEQIIESAPLFLERLRVPFTGFSAGMFRLTNNKVRFKEVYADLLARENIFLPDYVTESRSDHFKAGCQYIVKPLAVNGSFDIDDGSVIVPDCLETLLAALTNRQRDNGICYFAEAYIDGREFNISILDGQVLPPAEMVFCDYPDGKAKILSYKAKWEQDSFEYRHTARTFDFPASDRPLLQKIMLASRTCTKMLNLLSFARLDFRVSAANTIFLLEVNLCPCLADDAGFFAACQRIGLSYDDMIGQIIQHLE